jgi:hypothetical protein
MFNFKKLKILSTCKHLAMKRWRFNEEELKVVPKGKGLAKRYKFSQEELEVAPKGKGLTKIGFKFEPQIGSSY